MKKQKKAKPGDERIVHDESQDWVERGSALTRLAADGRRDLEPVARAWLRSDDPYLAVEALGKLLTFWLDSPHVHDYVTTAILWLESAKDPYKRTAAARSLGSYMSLRQEPRDDILRALLRALEHDVDDAVQETCHETLLEQVALEAALELPRSSIEPFDRNTDVRWDLLEPLRARFRDES
jgi:hypothetical protein